MPVITPLSPSSLHLAWPAPGKPNGFITRYELRQMPDGPEIRLDTSTREYTLTGGFFIGVSSFWVKSHLML